MVDLKFENAKLKKELANAQKKLDTASIKKDDGLEAGSKEKVVESAFKKQDTIREKAFGK
jgi:hypothetical protein